MKFLRKLKSGNFWISLISAGVLIAEGIFDFEIKTEYLNQILLGLMGILTLFGIVSDHGDTSVILNSSSKEDKNETVNTNVSNIKSICDTVSLLLNKVSINSNLDIENVADIINEVKEINEVLHKETEKEEPQEGKKQAEKGLEQEEIEVIEEKHEDMEDKKEELIAEVIEDVKIENIQEANIEQNVIVGPSETVIKEISIVNN